MKKDTISFFNAFVPHAPFLFAPKNIYFQGVEKDCIRKERFNKAAYGQAINISGNGIVVTY